LLHSEKQAVNAKTTAGRPRHPCLHTRPVVSAIAKALSHGPFVSATFALTLLNGLSHLLELAPGVWRVLEPVLFQQVRSLIKQPSVRKKGNSNQLALDSVVCHDAREELA